MSSDWQQLESAFDRLMAMPESERQSHLSEYVRKHPELGAELERLLFGADRTLAFSIAEASNELLLDTEIVPGATLDGYRLIRQLGQGGMGVVFEARRVSDYEQIVAIKLGRQMLDRDASSRFLRERQILAQLVHPNIARLLDGGTTPGQMPYLVMEYIDGEQIDRYCQSHALDLPTVLSLFHSVCLAVAHAHRQLVIHRDIKPSNIMVQKDGSARLLDFGIAKIIDSDVAETRTQVQAMTPAYVSPEQLQGRTVGTSTDVYSLGLLLYELLTGHRAQDVGFGDLARLNRVVLEEQPPSLGRVLKGELKTCAARDLRERHRGWQRDLQAILLRALAKDPSRRYAGASDLAADIQRLRAGNPVEASGDALGYRLGKLARKHRYSFAAVVVSVSSLLVLTIGLTAFAAIARDARDDAQRRLVQSEALIQFLLGDLRRELEPNVSLQVLDMLGGRAMEYFRSMEEADQSDDSLAQMALSLRQIGDIRLSQGRFSEGLEAFQRAMELARFLYERDPRDDARFFDLGQSHFWIGFAAHRQGDLIAARQAFQSYLEVSQALVERDRDHQDWMLELSYALNNLGTLDQLEGKHEQARSRFQRSLELKQTLVQAEPEDLSLKKELADTLAWLADTEEALGDLRAAMAHQEQRWTLVNELIASRPGHRPFQRALGYASLALARSHLSFGQSDAAAALLVQSIDLADARIVEDPENLQNLEDAARPRLDLARLTLVTGDHPAAASWLLEAEGLISGLLLIPEPEPVWQIELHGRLLYLDALKWMFAGQLSEATGAVRVLDQYVESQAQRHPSHAYLRRLHARVELLRGDFSAMQCSAQHAVLHWQSVLDLLSQASTFHPDNLAIEAVARARLAQALDGNQSALRLEAIGYAEPWYRSNLHAFPFAMECDGAESGIATYSLTTTAPRSEPL